MFVDILNHWKRLLLLREERFSLLSYPFPLLGEVSSLGNANSSLLYDDR
jgi:hypothetical protein